MKKILFLIFLIIPFVVKAEEILAEDVKYFKTVDTYYVDDHLEDLSNFYITNTYEITKEEYDLGEPEPSRNNVIIETTYKRLSIYITRPYTSYRYTATLYWKNIPKTRSYDIMGIAYYMSVTPGVEPSFIQEWCDTANNCSSSVTHYQYSVPGGIGAMFHLPSGNLSYLQQTYYVSVVKTNPNSTIVSQYAIADYSHATSTISYANAKKFDVNLGGISLDPTITSYYDSISYASADWSGTW